MLRDTSVPAAADAERPAVATGATRHRHFTSSLQIADRAAFARAVERQWAKCRRQGDCLALLVIAPGQAPPSALASRLLELVGLRLRARLRSDDVVMRVGAEHFAVVRVDASEAQVRGVKARLNRVLRGPYTLEGLSLEFSPDLGHAVYPHTATDGEALVAVAWRPGATSHRQDDHADTSGQGGRPGAT